MDDNGFDELPPEEDEQSSAYLSGNGVPVGGLYLTPWDHPECISDEEFDCALCDFFEPSNCALREDPFLLNDTRVMLELIAERQKRFVVEQEELRRRREAIIETAEKELRQHGRPLHFAHLGKIIRSRYPQLGVTNSELVKAMYSRPDLFTRLEAGVYGCVER